MPRPYKKKQPVPRFLEGLPVREGRADIIVQPSKADIANANPRDPNNCAYAQCLKRTMSTNKVLIFTSVCYVEVLDEKGQPWMERFVVSNHAHAYIKAFDRGEPVAPGGFILKKPTGGKTLDHKRKQSRDWAHANPDKSRASARKNYVKRKLAPPRSTTGTFRNGTGLVHLIPPPPLHV